MNVAGSLSYDTKLDTGGFEKGLGKLSSVSVAVGNVMAQAFTKVVSAIGDIGKKAINLASDLEEVQNVVDVTFGKDASKINEWSKQAATSFGMSELSAKKFNGTMGAMLKSMGLTEDEVLNMSTNMVGLAGDMASFYNLDHEEAFNKIRAGISGETEPLKQLGINMSVANLEAYALSQGIEKSYNAMTESEKATLRYNYLMKTTADAQGDFERTSDSFANQQRILQLNFENLIASIGEKVLPRLTDVISLFNDLLTGTKELNEVIPEIMNIITEALMGLINYIVENLPMFLQMGIDILLNLISGIVQAIPQLIPAIIQAILTLIDTLLNNLDKIIEVGIQLIIALIEGIFNALPELVEKIPEIIVKICGALINSLPLLLSALLRIMVQLGLSMVKNSIEIVSRIPKMMKGIVNGFLKFVKDFANIGKNLVKGIWEGIASVKDWILDKIKGFGKGILNGLKDFFGIHSPSKLFKDEIGDNLILGVGVAFDKDSNLIDKQIKEFGDDVFDKMSNAVNMETGKMSFSGTSGSVSQILNANSQFTGNINNVLTLDGEVVYENQQVIQARKELQYGGVK